MKKVLLLILFSVIFPNSGWCFGSLFRELDTQNELSSRRTFASAKDKNGYIWFATRAGIDRYNGNNFYSYSLPQVDNKAMEHPKGIISSKDKKDIYVFSEKSIYHYDENIDSFVRLDKINLIKRENINVIFCDFNDDLWIGTTEHLYKYLQKDNKTTIHNLQSTNCAIFSIVDDCKKQLWVGTSNGVFNISLIGSNTHLSKSDKALSILTNKRIQSLFYDNLTASLWIGTFSNGLFIYNTKSHNISTDNNINISFPLRCITNVNKTDIWIGVDGSGIYAYNRFSYKFESKYSQDLLGDSNIKSNGIYHILNDNNSVWVSTYTAGALVYNKSSLISQYFKIDNKEPESFENKNINSILEDKKGRLWFGTNNGISRYDINNGEWRHFLQGNNKFRNVNLSLYEDNSGNIWACGYASDVIYIDTNDNINTLLLPREINKNRNKNYFYSIAQDDLGNIWLGGVIEELICYNPLNKTFKRFHIKRINQIVSYHNNTLVLATTKGVAFFNIFDSTIRYLNIKKGKSTINPIVQNVFLSKNEPNIVWIGTEGYGLFRYNLNTNTYDQYSTTNGLPSNNISSIKCDVYGRTWISTENGLVCLKYDSQQISVFYKFDGLPDNMFNPRAAVTLRNGNIIWGTPEGAFEINPTNFINKSESQFNLKLESFSLFYTPVSPLSKDSPLSKNINLTKEINLSHNQHSFSFDFINLNYFNSSKIVYSWKLDGFDNDWTNPSDVHKAIYTNIPPGKYCFRVKAMIAGDNNKFQERQVEINISNPWWNTSLSWLIYILCVISISYYLIKAYKDRIDAKNSDQKIKFFINVAHDIRTPLTLIKAPLSDIEQENLTDNGKSAIKLALNNTEKLINLVSQLLDFQKIERNSMSLHVEETNIDEYLKNSIKNFEPLLKNKQLKLQYICENKIGIGYIDQKKISVIIDNILSNAIKYTPEYGNIQVKSNIITGNLHLEIIDDGIGIPQNAQKKLFNRFYRAENAINLNETGSGIGLVLTKKMTILHKGKISLTSNEGMGTCFKISIPILKDNYSKNELIEPIYSHKDALIDDNIETSNKMLLLIVEDNTELLNYLVNSFNKQYNVIQASNGQEALEIVKRENPDFIISDVMMPLLSGIELCNQLKSQIETCHIPIILLSALSEREDMIKGLNTGADDYITKPFDISVLKSKIATIIKNRVLYRKKYLDKSAFLDSSALSNDLDKKFISKIIENIEENLINEEFSIDTLATEMAMSRTTFYKKLKSLTGQNPKDFIKDLRMKKAASLLRERKYTISEIAYLTGFPNSKYFSTTFKKYYGNTPTTFIEQENNDIISE